MRRFTIVFENPVDFFRQDIPPGKRLPTRILRRFVNRHSPSVVAEAIGELDPAHFQWERVFHGGNSWPGEQNSLGLQDALDPVYYAVLNPRTTSQTIFRLLLCAIASQNAAIIDEIFIPELKRRGHSRGAVHAQINPNIDTAPPYEHTGSEDPEYISPDLEAWFLARWDASER